MHTHTDVIIIGAGPAGLTAGYCLGKGEVSVRIFEKDPVYVGGISRTVNYKDYLFDIGGHRFFSKSKEVCDLWLEILPNDFVTRPRLSRIYYDGKYYSYPLKAFEALWNLGIFRSIKCVLSYMYARAFPVAGPKTFHQWVRNQFGEELFSIFFRTYTEKVWGMSCDEISADWAAQRIKGLSLGGAIWNALTRPFRGKGGTKVKTLIEGFQYPRRGPGMMWDAAAEKIRAFGGEIRMGEDVVTVSYDKSQKLWSVASRGADGLKREFTARHVISSAPVHELMNKVLPSPISRLQARELRYRDFFVVALICKKPDMFPDNWIYIHDPSVKVGRVQNFRSWSPDLVPEEGMSCLGLEYFCFEGDGLWTSRDEDLIKMAKSEAAKIGLVSEDEVVDACVVRQQKAYPVYDEHYKAHVDEVRLDIQVNYPNLHLVGRNGMHKYNNQDHAMMTGMLTARNIIAGQQIHDVWNVNEDAEYHEAGSHGEQEALKSERLVPEKLRRSA